MLDKYFYEVFESVPRQGPGSIKETQRAYFMLEDIPEKPKILDIGCGNGIQTLELARLSNGHITALDNNKHLLANLEKGFKNMNYTKYNIVLGDMFNMPFKKEEFDIIWAEGSIFVIGVEQGISKWKEFLKSGGYLVFSEACWFRDDPPKDLIDYWKNEYPDLKSIVENIESIIKSGFDLIDHFHLPEYCWKEEFYDHIERKISELKKNKYQNNKEALTTLDNIMNEIRIFDKYNHYFGYEFYILKKN